MPAPANDDFANAQVISGPAGSTACSNVSATTEASEPHVPDDVEATIWFEWTAPASGNFTFVLGGPDYRFLAIYTGASLAGLSEEASDFSPGDPAGDLNLEFAATSGTTYKIQAGNYPGSSQQAMTLKWFGPPRVIAKIYDLGTTVLADISAIAFEKTLERLHNGARSFTIQAPAGHALLTAIAGDGYPNLRKGNRKLVVWEDANPAVDDPIFHGRIHHVERVGDTQQVLATITAYDTWMELGYDADDRAGRVVRGSTVQPDPGDPYGNYDGNFISPLFASSVASQAEISGPDLIQQILTNSQNTGGESDPTPGEGPLPIDLVSGTFDLEVPPAIDVSPVDSADWPVLIGDFIKQLVDTNVVDVDMIPVRPGTGLNLDGDPDPFIMVKLNAVNRQGTDRSGTVHFDYLTGDHNANGCRHVEDFATICNKLYDYLGPRIDQAHWRAVITPGGAGTTVDPTDSRALYHGQFMTIRVFDSLGSEASSRPLYLALWNGEMGLRVEPRELLFITPNPDAKALWQPPLDYDVGDVVAINTGAGFGIALAENQRVYGYTKTWSRENVASVGALVTSADAA